VKQSVAKSQKMNVDSSAKKSPVDDAKTSLSTTITIVTLYVLSGCSQPLMMTLLRRIGVADPTCQLYMLFYYFGPAAAIFTIPRSSASSSASPGGASTRTTWPSFKTISKACCIAIFDIAAQTMNYTGASLAGPTIFAIVYSRVTIWAALYSQLVLGRTMDSWQWIGVVGVFGGFASTAADSLTLGSGVLHGLVLVTIGSSMHGLFYVMSEVVMTVGTEKLSVQQNCAVQGIGGQEMCFTRSNCISLVAVSGGVLWYGISTKRRQEKGPKASMDGYARIDDAEGIEIEAI
jgi:hypothetical protein